MFVCAGVARLARFNITAANVPHDAYGKSRYFEGLPIPSSLALVGLMALSILFGRFETSNGPWVPSTTTYPYTGRFLSYLGVASGAGVPFGEFVLDLTVPVYKLLTLGDVLPQFMNLPDIAQLANSLGYIAVHKVSIIFALWSMAMVSKTLRVPKP